MTNRSKGILFVVSGPSGAGKTTLCKELMRTESGLEWSVSHTTRPMRSGEREGVDYYFISQERFQSLIEASAFAEWAHVHGNRYGTSFAELERITHAGHDALIEIDVQGAESLKKRYPDAVLIFLLPPDEDTLRQRLRTRGTDSAEEIARRLSVAPKEIAQQKQYDYDIVNREVGDTLEQMRHVVQKERQRRRASL